MKESHSIDLTDAEWEVMECLWEKSPLNAREASEALERRTGWKRSTTLTLLRRLEQKGVVSYTGEGKNHLYAPLVQRDEVCHQETEALLDRLYHGSVSLMVSTLTRRQPLTKEEIAELYEILKSAEVGDP